MIKNVNFETKYVVDEMAASLGHTVLRLPPYYCILNPIELVWSQLKRSIKRKNSDPKSDTEVVRHIHESVDEITSKQWAKYVDHVKKIEKSYLALDKDIDDNKFQFQEIRFTVNTGESSESDYDDFEDDFYDDFDDDFDDENN